MTSESKHPLSCLCVCCLHANFKSNETRESSPPTHSPQARECCCSSTNLFRKYSSFPNYALENVCFPYFRAVKLRLWSNVREDEANKSIFRYFFGYREYSAMLEAARIIFISIFFYDSEQRFNQNGDFRSGFYRHSAPFVSLSSPFHLESQ